jgi:hypothetical protein
MALPPNWYSRFVEEKNLSLLPGIQPGPSRPENSHCTDRAIPDAGAIHAIVQTQTYFVSLDVG